ncbi:MAG: DUF4416 family protein, partial [Spirochaetes bacterium]|nr:DUF4416 family protein [Spirochaetota bacterium]
MKNIIKQDNNSLFFSAVTVSDMEYLKQIEPALIKLFGRIYKKSKIFNFSSFTDYYEKEMGMDLLKQFYVFEKPQPIKNLIRYKIKTNIFEEIFTKKNRSSKNRCINIDPGYITLAKLVLASTKNYAHRIYLDRGIFAEITLSFHSKTFVNNPWTYPDYMTKEAINFFNDSRDFFKKRYYSGRKP